MERVHFVCNNVQIRIYLGLILDIILKYEGLISMESEFKYPDGKPICNGDMFAFKDGNIGFVFYDAQTETWTVKFRAKGNSAFVEPLKSLHRWIASWII